MNLFCYYMFCYYTNLPNFLYIDYLLYLYMHCHP